MKSISTILALLVFPGLAFATDVILSGNVQEKGTRNPLGLVQLYCFVGPDFDKEGSKPIKILTDSDGHFTVTLPEGDYKWIASLPNYKRFELSDHQSAGADIAPRKFILERTTYLTYETTVYGQQDKRDEKTKTLDQSQFLTVPGANGDPVKAVQNLPGVNRANAFSSQVIIEGSSPNDTRYDIDNQNVPIIFHFGGLSSVVIPEAVDHVDYLSAGFGPEFGQSTAGLVNLSIKDPKTDRVHGFIYADLLNTGGMIEGPINDHSSFLWGLRQSYVGFALKAALGSHNSNLDLTAVPEFRDTVFEYKNRISSSDSFRLIGVGSQDTLAFLFPQPSNEDPSIRGGFHDETDFVRLIPEWTHKFNEDLTGRLSFGIGKDWINFNISDYFLNLNETVLTSRAEIEDQITPAWKSIWGLDSQLYWVNLDFQLPFVFSQGGVINPISASSTQYSSGKYTTHASGLYWRNIIHPEESRWTWLPGVRLSYYNMTSQVIPEPRLAAKYALDHGLTLRAATGLYDEAPPLQDMDPNYGNPGLKSQRGFHATAGFEKDFRDGAATGWTLTDDVFYKYLYDTVTSTDAFVSPSQPLYYDNSGVGHVYGMEVLVKYKTSSWEGWIAYTLSKSTVDTAIDHDNNLSRYDQTHNLTAVGDIEMGRNWKFSGRIRYTTGDPYTPISGAILDVDNDQYTPIRGALNSERLGAFFEIDARFDKKWIYNNWILTAYLDVENVTNQKNPQQLNYNYNYSQSAIITGLPFLPTLGVKAEF